MNGPQPARIHELAIGFSLGELTQVELEELAELLRGPDGAMVAREAWQVLLQTTDLKVVTSGPFLAEVRARLIQGASSPSEMVQRRLQPSSLPEIDLGPTLPPPRPRWWIWAGILLLIAALATALTVAVSSGWLVLLGNR